jgi:two-component sensor histidine kinase
MAPRAGTALAMAGLALGSCAGGHSSATPPLQSLAEVARLDRSALEMGRAVDTEAVTVYHDPSWGRLVVQENGHCIAVDAAGVDSPLPPGERVRLTGFTAFERNGPVIVLPRIARLARRGVRTWTRTELLSSSTDALGVECVEVHATVRGVRQLDSGHTSVEATANGGRLEGIVIDIPNSSLLQEGDAVILRGAVEMVATADGSPRWRIYLQGGGSFERVGGRPRRAQPSSPAPSESGSPLLTGLLQVKTLSADQAGRGLPVRVRGVVTGASGRAPGGAQEIVLQDSDCGLYATTESDTATAALGHLVEIEGRTSSGAFAPIVVYSRLRVLGKAPLPRPLPVAGLMSRLTAQNENVWAQVKGVLRPHSADFAVATPDGELPLFFFTGDSASLQRFVDAEVEVAGVFAVVHRARQVVGYRLLVENPEQLVVTAPATDPAAAASWPIAQLFAYWPSGRPLHRVSIRGVVTGVFHPDKVYVDDGAAAVLCETAGRPQVGAAVAASGFLPVNGPEHHLTHALVQELRWGGAQPPPPLLTLEQLLGGEQDGRLLRVVGRLRERARSRGHEQLTFEADQRTFSVALEAPTPTASVQELRVGSELRVTGIGEMDWDRTTVPPRVRAVRILVRSPADLELLRAASWWTPGRTFGLLATVLALAAASLVWLVSLRRQVRRQTTVIRSQMESLEQQAEERERARKTLEKSLAEQLVLLREVHHRVKNNLQAIIHLMELEQDRIGDPQARSLLDGLRERARTMALVYEQVYQSPSLARVDMGPYLQALAERLQAVLSEGRPIRIDVEAAGVSLDVSKAMPCGLIVNELLTNALKHAFPSGVRDGGRIRVALAEARGTARLEVSDDGVGMPPKERRRLESLGLQLVSLWATHQLGGRLDVRSGEGTAFTVEFVTGP